MFPPTKWAAEFNAALTVPFFHWLVGPSEVVEVEVNGVKQKSGVLIKKCRYLENSGCVGMCVNMCKIPTQDFFTNEFGLPLTMTPNFEDMSCEMVYGQVPPKFEDDPASIQPCLSDFCKSLISSFLCNTELPSIFGFANIFWKRCAALQAPLRNLVPVSVPNYKHEIMMRWEAEAVVD
ncbi:UNVERIFIED_CONTAM: Beta-carotene isomerase D27, chloroplastic [Sesamum radiatum]|uniref:Beta-carotene isomerase D27, chloroplastic n=1 Tax=Sesamum radiatum TaxID=300843 RepID=A0AAW2JP50_SESRA